MQIRTKLSLYFTLISAVLLLMVLLAINILFAKHTKDDFFNALRERAIVTAQVYLEADEISDSSLQHFKEEYLNTLPREVSRMYDSTNHPAFIKDPDRHWKENIVNEVKQKKYVQYIEKENAVVGIRYDDNQGSFVILVSAMDKQGKEREYSLLRITAIIYFLQLMIVFIISRWFAKKALQPVKKINKQVQRITATDLHLRVEEENNKDEISELAVNFNSLLQRLETSFEIQKTFVANASHELRTPLTNIIGEVEVIISQSRDNAEYKEVLLSVLSEADKLKSIIDSLLNLAGSENLISVHRVEPVRIDELLWELQAAFKKNHPPDVLHVELLSLPENESRLCVMANKQLLILAFSNIIRNAFKFSHNQAVSCCMQYNPEGLLVSIADKGIGIKEQDLQKIFQPFYRSSEAHTFEGQGLGLFIAKKIVDLYKGRITIQSNTGLGTTVNILFTEESAF